MVCIAMHTKKTRTEEAKGEKRKMEWRIKGLIERDDKVGDRGRDFARSIMRSVGVAQDTYRGWTTDSS